MGERGAPSFLPSFPSLRCSKFTTGWSNKLLQRRRKMMHCGLAPSQKLPSENEHSERVSIQIYTSFLNHPLWRIAYILQLHILDHPNPSSRGIGSDGLNRKLETNCPSPPSPPLPSFPRQPPLSVSCVPPSNISKPYVLLHRITCHGRGIICLLYVSLLSRLAARPDRNNG